MPPSPEPRQLEPFEGHDVIGARIKVTNAGDGLSDALSVDPSAFDLGAEVYVVLKCEVAKVQYVEVKDTDSLVREHSFKAKAATLVDKELVGGLIDAQTELIRKRKEEEAGIQSIPFDQPPAEHPAVELLNRLKKARLQAIATENAVDYPKSATSARLIELLVENVANIEDIAQHALESENPDDEATVTPISRDDWS